MLLFLFYSYSIINSSFYNDKFETRDFYSIFEFIAYRKLKLDEKYKYQNAK